MYLLLSQLHCDVHQSLITDITAKSNSLDLEIANQYLIKLSEKENGLNFFITDFVNSSLSLKIELNSSQDSTNLFEIDEKNADNGFLIQIGIAAFAIIISTNNNPVLDENMELFGFNAQIHFEYNSDKSIKVARMVLTQGDLSILIEKNEDKSVISFMGIEISSDTTTPLKEKGEEIYNKIFSDLT